MLKNTNCNTFKRWDSYTYLYSRALPPDLIIIWLSGSDDQLRIFTRTSNRIEMDIIAN